ncbi:MAG: N-acetyltransferase protein [Patescibacteria group bacterium]|nr:N-acetyltransferase protein [Patescibacteria group bacterium]
MKIRPLQKKDIKICSEIVGKNYNNKYQRLSALELRDMFGTSQFKPLYYVAEEKGKILGFAGVMQSPMDYSVWHIFWVNVLPTEQKKGIGKKLVSKVIEVVKKKKDAHLILLTALIPEYYKQHFSFKTIDKIDDSYDLMSLAIK